MLASELIKLGSKKLKENNISTHLLDSELILSNVTQLNREKLLTQDNKNITKDLVHAFNGLLLRRLKNEPMAYLLKKKEFYKNNFLVNSDTLIPRPETELLVEKITKIFRKKTPFILDIGTGSGCIIISLLEELRHSKGIGIDISKNAIAIAKKNAKRIKIDDRVKFFNKSIEDRLIYEFDVIVSNPPYICSHQIKNLSLDIKKYEPRLALDGGNDGLDVIRKVIYKAKDILKIKGILAIEVGFGQYRKVSQILSRVNFREKFLIKDYRNNVRCIISILEN